jgi:hypothetical protein
MTRTAATGLDFKQLSRDIYENGIANLPDVLPAAWADELDEDIDLQFLKALKIEGGAGVAFRGWNRYYADRGHPAAECDHHRTGRD